ncbi:hypothetical protein Tco_1234469 [Tanacetum coccineum]
MHPYWCKTKPAAPTWSDPQPHAPRGFDPTTIRTLNGAAEKPNAPLMVPTVLVAVVTGGVEEGGTKVVVSVVVMVRT